ncbi:MAG: hypothetical protein ACF8R7_08100 [Phycisphaerales bacterium JB039]
MNVAQFLEHWGVQENPFRAEEARRDEVFARLAGASGPGAEHSDFEKVLGDLRRPATSIVFGEKGSGKTAIRLQMASRIRAHNAKAERDKILLVAYDDLNQFLDQLHERLGAQDAIASLEQLRLSDHLDAMLSIAVTKVVDGLLGAPAGEEGLDLSREARRALRRSDRALRRDIALLQAMYDRSPLAEQRSALVRRALGLGPPPRRMLWTALALLGWLLPAAAGAAWWHFGQLRAEPVWWGAVGGAAAVWGLILLKRAALDPWRLRRRARRLRRRLRALGRSERSLARSLTQVNPRLMEGPLAPLSDTDESRYAMLARLREFLAPIGYAGLIILVDRVDEPTLVRGDPRAMQAVIWPLLSNTFLQQEGLGVKLLLPIELRHALFKESSAFFQEARLDKQHLIERLLWTGSMLYDLCEARLRSCRKPDAEPVALVDLFAEDVAQRDVVDALDQMRQPRDAFKLLYQCMLEHCSNVTTADDDWRIPRLTLEAVRKREVDRVHQLARGIRPA